MKPKAFQRKSPKDQNQDQTCTTPEFNIKISPFPPCLHASSGDIGKSNPTLKGNERQKFKRQRKPLRQPKGVSEEPDTSKKISFQPRDEKETPNEIVQAEFKKSKIEQSSSKESNYM